MAWRPRVVSGVAIVALVVGVCAFVVAVPSASADAAVNQRLLELANRERTAAGLRPLVADAPVVAAENLHGQLMTSPIHRGNILNATYTSVGIGSWRTAPGKTWTGADFPLANVYVGVEIFAAGAVDPVAAPPVAGSRFHPLPPARALDTRTGIGKPAGALGPGATVTVPMLGRAGVPSTGVAAVVLNVTITEPTAMSWLTVFPAGETRPAAANISYGPGQTVGNLVVAKLGAGGQISLFNAAGAAHVVADVAGWFDAG